MLIALASMKTVPLDGTWTRPSRSWRAKAPTCLARQILILADRAHQGADAVVGEAIAAAARPPRVWLQMSTATIYAHRFDAAHDEAAGVIGGSETGVPDYGAYSVEIAKNWERAQAEAPTPGTRKVALRSAMVMSPDRGGVFDVLSRLARLGLGGPVARGAQYVSWIHDEDFVRAVEFLIARDDLEGPVNPASPGPLPHRDFMRALRTAWGVPLGLPATRWMAELGAFALRSDTELLLKSRRVVPGRLRAAGFAFAYSEWESAAASLVQRAVGCLDAEAVTDKPPHVGWRMGGAVRGRYRRHRRAERLPGA
ncbi:DUF1731 domain-containing protein [Streptomyces pseudovenezuelae]|uniref:DUF1731 domain-containing protein n=2 Tax=Streptomyces TaxID=1883 RepID=UPI000AC4CF1D